MEAAELPLWLRALEPLSVPFVILLMLAGWLLEARRDRERRRRHDARIRANAYELFTVLMDWRTEWPAWAHPEIDDVPNELLPEVDDVLEFARTIAPDTRKVRKLAREMVTDAPTASSSLAEVAREVYPRVASAAVYFENLAGSRPMEDEEGI